ncbi:MAG: hypothetical protein ACLR3R_20185 [Clostridium paraputrificum]
MQVLNEQLPKICDESVETIENYNKMAEAAIEELEEQAKFSGSPKLIDSIAKLRQSWEQGLKVSHKQTVELYQVSAEESRKLLAAL